MSLAPATYSLLARKSTPRPGQPDFAGPATETGSRTDLRRYGIGVSAVGPVADVRVVRGEHPGLVRGRFRVVALDRLAVLVAADVYCLADDAHGGQVVRVVWV